MVTSSRVSERFRDDGGEQVLLAVKMPIQRRQPDRDGVGHMPMATPAYPLRENRSRAASRISWRRFAGRVPRAGRAAGCRADLAVVPVIGQDTWLAFSPQYCLRSSRLRILPAPDIGMASTKSTLRGAL